MPTLKTLLIAAAGTGGHVFPALVIAEQARAQGIQIIWLGTEEGLEKRIVPKAGFELITISSSGVLGKSLFKKSLGVWNLLKSTFVVMQLIKKRKPDIVFGFGGYITMPAGIAAILKRVPLLLHEQNAVMGLSNRLLAGMAKTVYLGFPDTVKRSNALFVGNPLRQVILDIHKDQMPAGAVLKILIVGGSRGARVFNQVLPEAAARVLAEKKILIWHQTGEAGYQSVKTAYTEQGIDAKVTPFIEDMAQAYQWADLIICRAGALTVAEVTAVGVAALFVPFSQATHDHQTANARYLVEQKAALLLAQAEFSAASLAKIILAFDVAQINSLASRAKSLRASDVSARILSHIHSL